jgi:hypothetical protein
MERRRADGQRGFVITLELILIFTILGIGLLVGIVAIRNALVVWWAKKQAQTVWVYDSSSPARVLGPARDFDEHEAPRLFYIDREVDWCSTFAESCTPDTTRNYRAFVGVRDDRFTSRHRIFYENSTDCGVTQVGGGLCGASACPACIVRAGNEAGDSLAIGKVQVTVTDGTNTSSGTAQISEAGGIGYLYPLQSGPSYGIGRDLDDLTGLPGSLYRETPDACDEEVVRSRWTSQTVTGGLPCEPLPAGVTVEAAKCPDGADGGEAIGEQCGNVPPADPRCTVAGRCTGAGAESCRSDAECPGLETCQVGSLQCGCPGFDNLDPSDNWVDFGANCCPPGTTQTAPGQCSIGDTAFLARATAVQLAGQNALSWTTAPFHVNLPPDPTDFVTTAPGGFEGAPAGAVTGTYDGDVSFDFDTPAAGGESGPP